MKKYTIDELKSEFAAKGYKWFDHIHFVGIRSKENKANQFDDLFGVINGNTVKWYTCTTNAGTHWLKNLLNPKGTSLLKPNQYVDTWKLGLHKGTKALVQVKPVTVFRDKNLNDKAEESAVTDTGMFGLNIHGANTKMISRLIDRWSAGCQVLNNPKEYLEFIASAEQSKRSAFTYTLLNEFEPSTPTIQNPIA